MLSINLLPENYRRYSNLKRKRKLLLLSFGFMFILLFTSLGFIWLNNTILQSQLESVHAYQKNIEKQIEALAPFEEIYINVENAIKIANETGVDQMDWGGILTRFGSSLPQGIVITELNANNPKGTKAGEFRIRGRAGNQMQVSAFLEDLEQITLFSNLQCRFIRLDGEEGSETQFEITMDISQK